MVAQSRDVCPCQRPGSPVICLLQKKHNTQSNFILKGIQAKVQTSKFVSFIIQVDYKTYLEYRSSGLQSMITVPVVAMRKLNSWTGVAHSIRSSLNSPKCDIK